MSYLPSRDIEHVLAHTAELWNGFRGESLFLTGGTGFVGTWLLETFLAANERFDLRARIVVLSRDPGGFLRRAPQITGLHTVEFVQGSPSSFEFPERRFAYVIHAATEQGLMPSPASPEGPFDQNVLGTRRVLEFARHRGARRVLLTSSGAVYGKQPSDVAHLDEDHPYAPATNDVSAAYGHSKRVSEFLGCAYGTAYGYEVLLARLFAFAGPLIPLNLNFAVGNFVRDALQGGPIRIAGDGTALRSYLYAADLAIWLWTILLKGTHGRAYNVGSSEAMSIIQLAEAVRAGLPTSSSIEISVAKKSVAGEAPARYVPSNARAAIELGLVPQIPLTESIRRMIEWYSGRSEG
jgi:nucleoside-diphosphate-sugar epimerase